MCVLLSSKNSIELLILPPTHADDMIIIKNCKADCVCLRSHVHVCMSVTAGTHTHTVSSFTVYAYPSRLRLDALYKTLFFCMPQIVYISQLYNSCIMHACTCLNARF